LLAVDDSTVDQVTERARESIIGTGEQLDEAVFSRFAARLCDISGDVGEPSTYDRVAKALEGASCPVFYLEIPPFLFGRTVKGSTGVQLTLDAHRADAAMVNAITLGMEFAAGGGRA
jgi:glucose-6-phosphate 1-dehydrogenase